MNFVNGKKAPQKSVQGFSLIELMIVVAVIAIIASIAIPAYGDYVIRGKLVDATAQLSDGRIQMEQYFQDNRTYVGGPGPATTKYFTISCQNMSASTYTIVADGRNELAGFGYQIDQGNNKISATPWGNGATCWIMRKGDTC
jgi:type IV pilus assembly protein PilE